MSAAVKDNIMITPVSDVHHYTSPEEVPVGIIKYWYQRHDIFSKYDDGIWMTDDAWFGVTPEPIALEIAKQVAAADCSKTVLIDAFAGAGANAIAFALSDRWNQIFAVERDPSVLACAKHNAQLYGVEKKIWWILGDTFEVLHDRLKSTAKNAVIFGSPPWGGPTYVEDDVFNLATMEPYSLSHIYASFSLRCSDIVLYLPRSSDLQQLAKHCTDDRKLRVIHYCMYGASKALCVYYGDFQLQ